MTFTKDHKTCHLFDPFEHLGPKRRKLLEESWAGLFRAHVLNELPVGKLARYFTSDFGRPTKELYSALGVVVLQQVFDLSDEETVRQLAFNMEWHFALDIIDASDAAAYFCPKTIFNLRRVVLEHDLDGDLFETVTGKLAEVFGVDTRKQRLDSVHIKSDMRKLGRLGILARTIHKFLVNLKRQHLEEFDVLETRFDERYLAKKEAGCFSMVKPSESGKKLGDAAVDLFELVGLFADNTAVSGMSSYKLMVRVLKEQCTVIQASDDGPAVVSVKPPKEVPSDSLQNPSDPDAGYDGHKGQGYQVQVMETYSEAAPEKTGDADDRQMQLNLITHVEVEPAHVSDVNALIPALESTANRGLSPEVVLADSLYGSDKNVEQAKEMNVEVSAPVMGKSEKGMGLSDFEFSQDGDVSVCPEGHAPAKVKRNRRRRSVGFDAKQCRSCPRLSDCPVKPGKRYHLRYSEKELRLARRRANEKSPEFKDMYRYRAGVEATMSEYDRRTGVKRLRVRGSPAVRVCAKLKALGINILRAACVRKALKTMGRDPEGVESRLVNALYREISCYMAIWKRLSAIWRRKAGIFVSFAYSGEIDPCRAD